MAPDPEIYTGNPFTINCLTVWSRYGSFQFVMSFSRFWCLALSLLILSAQVVDFSSAAQAETAAHNPAETPKKTLSPGHDENAEGNRLYREKKFPEAIALFKQALEKGNPFAAESLGYIYRTGMGNHGKRDKRQALEWYQKGAELGSKSSMSWLGHAYIGWSEIPKDPEKAEYWYVKSAEAGNHQAYYDAAQIFAQGKGVPKDPAKAFAYYEKGAQAGHGPSLHSLGTYYREGKTVEKNIPKALEYYEKAVEAKDASAYVSLGKLYYHGADVPVDYAKAKEYFTKGSQNAYVLPRYYLGEMYMEGLGVEKDLPRAFGCFKGAAESQNVDAMFQVAEMYAKGIGTAKNYDEAYRWYNNAANKGHVMAKRVVATLPKPAPKQTFSATAGASGTPKSPQQAFIEHIHQNGPNPADLGTFMYDVEVYCRYGGPRCQQYRVELNRFKNRRNANSAVSGSGYSPQKSGWGGFTYTQQTTDRYNQTIRQGDQKRKMDQFKRDLNSSINRRY